MNNSTKFTVIMDKLNKKISELNIQISKNQENKELKKKLDEIISDKDILYKGNVEDLENLIKKYGENK